MESKILKDTDQNDNHHYEDNSYTQCYVSQILYYRSRKIAHNQSILGGLIYRGVRFFDSIRTQS